MKCLRSAAFGQISGGLTLALALVLGGPARGDEAEEPGTTRQEIVNTLHDVQRKYGSDAVMLQGHLLGQAIRAGSITDAAIRVSGIEERNGKRFLAFKLDTGIIYNDREVSAASRRTRVWNDLVEASLRKFHALDVPADGIALLLGYAHQPYAGEAELRTHLRDAPGDAEAMAVYLLRADVIELTADRIDGQQLIDRSTVLIDGAPARLVLDPPAAPTPAEH